VEILAGQTAFLTLDQPRQSTEQVEQEDVTFARLDGTHCVQHGEMNWTDHQTADTTTSKTAVTTRTTTTTTTTTTTETLLKGNCSKTLTRYT